MNSIMYISMMAANRMLEKQAIIANNLANISTLGFKEQLVTQTLSSINNSKLYKNDSIISEKNYLYSNFSSGPINYTKRNLDLSIKGNGWFVVKDYNSKHQEGYTRNGHLKINSDGKLMINNYLVMGTSGTISLPKNKKISISSSGIIYLMDLKKEKIKNKILGKLKLIDTDPKYLKRGNNGIFYLNKQGRKKLGKVIPDNHHIRLNSGMLEDSNVNINENLINMISNERSFSIEMKIISNDDENSQRANQLLNINS
ncbi:flagellar hook-basal body complex protein [Buchnera aphidicola]|uniref:flagellar hook-basal body complex protein n=1 Tax=Buchnera aphidicola TaxID=9 RepID=UPI003463D268